MKIPNSILLALFTAGLFCINPLQAQVSANASGGDFKGSGGTVAFSIGQVLYTTNAGSTGTVAQGVQQAYEIFIVGAKDADLDISLSAFPNPVSDQLTLQIKNFSGEKLSYQLFDLGGKMLGKESINTAETNINTAYLPASTYLIHVFSEDQKPIQSFKIIKN